jgi:hypothetical protein
MEGTNKRSKRKGGHRKMKIKNKEKCVCVCARARVSLSVIRCDSHPLTL